MTRNKLYSIFILLIISGALYFVYDLFRDPNSGVSLCIFKNITGIPCPSCGTTRSLRQLFHGEFLKALLINPLGYVMIVVIAIIPVWISYDLITKKSTFFVVYKKTEIIINKKPLAILLVILVLANWIWNIYKQL